MRWESHRRWERSVEQLVDGELPDLRDEAVRHHLRDCPNCSLHAAVLLAIRGALQRVVRRWPPAGPAPTRRARRQPRGERPHW